MVLKRTEINSLDFILSFVVISLPRTRSVALPPQRLPSARTVSNNVFQWSFGGMTPVSASFSTFLTHHGQFIDHDIIATPSETRKHFPTLELTVFSKYCLISVMFYLSKSSISVPNNVPILDCCNPVG